MIARDISALENGGTFLLVGTTSLIIKNIFITGTRAQYGGAVNLKYLENLTLTNFSCEVCKASFDGGVIYSLNSNIILNGGTTSYYLAPKSGGYAFVKGGSFNIEGGFQATFGLAEKGGFLFALNADGIFLQNISLSNSSAKEEGIFLLLEDCSRLLVNNITLEDLNSDSGLGCIFIYARSISALYFIQDVHFFKVILVSSSLVQLENGLKLKNFFNFTLRNVVITNCISSVAYLKSENFYIDHIILLENIIVSEFNSQILLNNSTNITLPEQVFILENCNLLIKNLSLKSIGFSLHCLSFLNSIISVDLLLFQANFIPDSKSKVLTVLYAFKTTAKVLRISFLAEQKSNTALLLSDNSMINLENGTISKCQIFSTSCIEFYKSHAQFSSLTFLGNKGYVSGVISARNSSMILDFCDFKLNSAVKREIQISKNTAVNDILILGKLEAPIIIRFCSFVENSTGTSIFAISASLNLSYCNFFTSFSSTVNISVPFKAIWSSNSDMEILFSNFSNFISENGGTLKIEHENGIINDQKFFTLQNSLISNSTSDLGGAFSLIGLLNIHISNNQFYNNKALKDNKDEYGNFGVGIYLCTFSCTKSSFELLSNVFINNLAENWMATLFSNVKILISVSTIPKANNEVNDSNKYINNTDSTLFVGNITFLPLTITSFMTVYTLNQTPNQTNFNDSSTNSENNTFFITSGQAMNLNFVLLDGLGHIFIIDRMSSAEITDTPKGHPEFFSIPNKKVLSFNAEFRFENHVIKSDLNKSFELQLLIHMNVNYVYPATRDFITVEPLVLQFFTKPCEVGDIIIAADSTCVRCPPNKYSIIDPMKTYNNSLNFNIKCLVCPSNAICTGGSVIIPEMGFWRYSNTSTLMIECLSKNSCLGFDDGKLVGDEFIHGRCIEHSFGPLCYLCEPGYGRFSKKGLCQKCTSEIVAYIRFGIIVLMFIIYAIIQIKLAFQSARSSKQGILLKIIITHFQQLNLISLVDLGWTPEFKVFFSFQDLVAPLTEDLLPLDCLLQNFGYNSLALKILSTNVYPVVLSLIVLLLWLIFLKLFIANNELTLNKLINIIQICFFIVFLILFPEVISKCLSLFTCLTVEDSGSTRLLLYSPSIVCWSEEHKSSILKVALPGLLAWGLLAPAIIAFNLYKFKSEIKILLERERTYRNTVQELFFTTRSSQDSPYRKISRGEKAISLRFLCKGYSSKYYYWELFVFMKKFLLIAIGCITDLFPSKLSGVFLLIPISCFLLIQVRFRPLENKVLNKIELFSLLTIFLTSDMGILMFSKDFRKYSSFP